MKKVVTEPKYPLDQIYWAYTQDGKIANPYVINRDRNKIKDVMSGLVVSLEKDDPETMISTLKWFYNVDNNTPLAYLDTCGMILSHTDGAKIDGEIFDPIKRDLIVLRVRGEYIGNDDSIINDTRLKIIKKHEKEIKATAEDLKPLQKQVKKFLEKEYKLDKLIEQEEQDFLNF